VSPTVKALCDELEKVKKSLAEAERKREGAERREQIEREKRRDSEMREKWAAKIMIESVKAGWDAEKGLERCANQQRERADQQGKKDRREAEKARRDLDFRAGRLWATLRDLKPIESPKATSAEIEAASKLITFFERFIEEEGDRAVAKDIRSDVKSFLNTYIWKCQQYCTNSASDSTLTRLPSPVV
jgi:hypothetical protein